jgi:hypothetical protein
VPFHVVEYSENISRALEIVFAAKDVPSRGYRTYYLTAADPLPNTARIQSDRDKDIKDPRRPLGSDTAENEYYRLTIDLATGRLTLFDKALNRDVARDLEVSALQERGGNYIGVEPPSGRTIPAMVDDIRVEENNAICAVIRVALRIGDITVDQRLTLYSGLMRLDIENAVTFRVALRGAIRGEFREQHVA